MNIIFKTALFVALFFSTSFSHPHTFIQVFPILDIKNEKVTNIHIKWIIDVMTSSMLIMEVDKNADGKIDTKENKGIYEEFFVPLMDYKYYTFVKQGEKDLGIDKPKNFQASIENESMVFAFDISKEYPLKNLRIEFFDEEYIMALITKISHVQLNGIEKSRQVKMIKDIFGVEN